MVMSGQRAGDGFYWKPRLPGTRQYIYNTFFFQKAPLHKNNNHPDTPTAVWLGLGRSTGTDPFIWIPSGSSHNDQVTNSNNATKLCAAYNYFNVNNLAVALNCTADKRRNILCESGIL